MKRLALCMTVLVVVLSFVYAEPQTPAPMGKPVSLNLSQTTSRTNSDDVPYYLVSRAPFPIMTSYYDYMIGSYNGLPLRVIPSEFGGGYFMTYQGRSTPESVRRVYYTQLDQQGNLVINGEITATNTNEGFPTMVVDPLSGKPIYTWHADVNNDGESEVYLAADALTNGVSGLPGSYQQMIFSNPISITAPNGVNTVDNHFIWPTAVIGPSPRPGYSRIYVSTLNSRSHIPGNLSCGNPLVVYADINGEMIENGQLPQWYNTSVPTFNLWNVDTEHWRRPFTALCADQIGNIYYIGYHSGLDLAGNQIDEPRLHVMKCDEYGKGTWTMVTESSIIPAWVPPSSPDGGEPHLVDEAGNLLDPDDLYWDIQNSAHVNATVDHLGRVHFPALWALSTSTTYFPNLHYVKQLVYDPVTNELGIHEVYPVKAPDNDYYECYHPWDNEPPWGEAEYIYENGEWKVITYVMWPFCYWDQTAHDGSMIPHYNNIRMSNPNQDGWTVVVWQDSQRALLNGQSDGGTEPGDGFVPDIMIAISADEGMTWQEPIRLSGVDLPQLADITPMWVYPADEVVYSRVAFNEKIGGYYHMGKLGLMFYDDYTWGSDVLYPPVHDVNDGGRVMFMELEIAFEPVQDADDSAMQPLTNLLRGNYPNPFNPDTTISYTLPAAGDAKLGIYNLRGQLVRSLVNEHKTRGDHKAVWDGRDDSGKSMPSGIYLYRLETGNRSQTRKMMLMK